MDVNKTILSGEVKNINIRKVGSYDIATISLCTVREFTLKDGSKRTEALYIDVNAWGMLCDEVALNVRQGSRIFVEGPLKQDKWIEDDVEIKRYSIKAESITVIQEPKENK